MPIYSYRCDKCGETFDKLIKAGCNGSVPCIQCKSETRRVFSPVGIIFKGSGFYSTDYKSGSTNAANKATAKNTAKDKKDQKTAKSGTDTKDKTAEKAKAGK